MNLCYISTFFQIFCLIIIIVIIKKFGLVEYLCKVVSLLVKFPPVLLSLDIGGTATAAGPATNFGEAEDILAVAVAGERSLWTLFSVQLCLYTGAPSLSSDTGTAMDRYHCKLYCWDLGGEWLGHQCCQSYSESLSTSSWHLIFIKSTATLFSKCFVISFMFVEKDLIVILWRVIRIQVLIVMISKQT